MATVVLNAQTFKPGKNITFLALSPFTGAKVTFVVSDKGIGSGSTVTVDSAGAKVVANLSINKGKVAKYTALSFISKVGKKLKVRIPLTIKLGKQFVVQAVVHSLNNGAAVVSAPVLFKIDSKVGKNSPAKLKAKLPKRSWALLGKPGSAKK